MRRVIAAFAFVAILGCAACGGNGSADANGVKLLQSEVAAARSAAVSGDYGCTLTRLSKVRESVFVLRARNQLSDARAQAVLAAVTDVEVAVRQSTTTTSTAALPTTTVRPPAAPPAKREKGHGGKH